MSKRRGEVVILIHPAGLKDTEMKCYKTLCHKADFAEFRTEADDLVADISAGSHDEFALLMATDLKNKVGFHTTPQGNAAISTLVSKCYSVNLQHLSIERPHVVDVVRMPRLLFRDHNGKFEGAVKEHEKYVADFKKYKVLSRHRPAQVPVVSTLAGLLQDEELWITGKKLSDVLDDTCHYVMLPVISGEHGRDAFTVFSSNLDFFFEEFNKIISDDSEITFVKARANLSIIE